MSGQEIYFFQECCPILRDRHSEWSGIDAQQFQLQACQSLGTMLIFGLGRVGCLLPRPDPGRRQRVGEPSAPAGCR
ncbi:hypothetical protein A6U85_01095 [Agrobacterium sp. 13-626]|nr:hypothetical protein CN09_04620 [Rhizobium rhizogenes]OCJ05611.1 hypothetical protein A6U85_01095 [Agrobacterium sp. 13-626]OCJ14778.1 hypothetical protein A6U89_21930 [Agrobacterium sp. B133/95]OCJ26177.1 hypothetical protein A6U88_07100 [Agrobacterium sp. B131/95]